MNNNHNAQTPHPLSDAEQIEHQHKMKERQKEQREKVAQRKEKRGILIVNTGNGKGKSTAAFGTAIRSAGHGLHVGIVLFVKGQWQTGERKILQNIPDIDLVVAGDGFTWDTQDLAQDIASAREGWDKVVKMIEHSRRDPSAYHLLVLDELNIALRYDYLPIDEIASVLRNRPKHLNVIVTGRDAKEELIDIADTVTDMTPIRHAFERGIRAQRGIEF